jgi:hypothetical protein
LVSKDSAELVGARNMGRTILTAAIIQAVATSSGDLDEDEWQFVQTRWRRANARLLIIISAAIDQIDSLSRLVGNSTRPSRSVILALARSHGFAPRPEGKVYLFRDSGLL